MKAYEVTLQVINFDELSCKDIISAIENTKYPNRCINPKVSQVKSMDIGEWNDDHPLNQKGSEKLFKDKMGARGEIEYCL